MGSKPLISFEEISTNCPLFHDLKDCPSWDEVFGNDNPIKLEIGFGNGGFLIQLASREPHINFIGIDMFHKGIRKLVTKAENLSLKNIHIVYGDARFQIQRIFKDNQLQEIFINFPDPWPKKRHTKRRLINADFVETLALKLKRGGSVHLATDFESYAMDMLTCFEAEKRFKNQIKPMCFAPFREDLPKTKYENNFLKEGKTIFYMDFMKQEVIH